MENSTSENTEKSSVKERLIEFINHENLSQSKFEKKANLSNGYVNNIKNSISDKVFDFRIHPAFPHLNKVWLLHGIGEMKIGLDADNSADKTSTIKNKPHDEQMKILYDRINDLEELMLAKDKENEERIKLLVEVIAKERNAIIDVIMKSFKEQKKESIKKPS